MQKSRITALCALIGIFVGAATWAGTCVPGDIIPASTSHTVRPAIAVDINPDPNIVEVNITARPVSWDFAVGNLTEIWAYNDVLPGPTIEVNIGDTLIVNFCNDLPETTTIHWHGMETPANMDGSNISQLAVEPNGGTFRYEFPLLVAGMFWYHPHIQTHVQVEKGLHGVVMVHDPVEDALYDLPTREHIFVLDDIWLDEDGQVVEPFLGTRDEVAIEQLNGREGNTPVFNGLSGPTNATRPTIILDRNVPNRIHMLNVANSRFMRMSIPEHSFWRIGGDQGLIEEAYEILPAAAIVNPVQDLQDPESPNHTSDPDPTTGVLLTGGERADLYFYTTENVTDLPLEWHDMQRGRHSVDFAPECCDVTLAHNVPDGTLPVLNWALINTSPVSEPVPFDPPGTLKDLDPIVVDDDTPKLPLVMGHTIPDWNTGESIFFLQDMMKPFGVLTQGDVHTVQASGTYIWDLVNMTGSHHNFHTHGWSFQHIETQFIDMDFPNDPTRNYTEPAERLENKDVLRIKRRPGTVRGRSMSITRMAVHFDETGRFGKVAAFGLYPTAARSGGWLAHCHILEHAVLGMLTFFQVVDLFNDGLESGDTGAWSDSVP